MVDFLLFMSIGAGTALVLGYGAGAALLFGVATFLFVFTLPLILASIVVAIGYVLEKVEEWLGGGPMKYKMTLRDTETGEKACWEDGWPYDFEGFEFMWTEGNYCCDCNRALYFSRALGLEDWEIPCGHGRFIIDRLEIEGMVLHEEEVTPENWELVLIGGRKA